MKKPANWRHRVRVCGRHALQAVPGSVGCRKIEHRDAGGSATFKLYILNRAEAFFGFYPITEHTVALDGQPVPMFDLMGKDVTLFHYAADDPTGIGEQYLAQAQAWFDSMWGTVSSNQPR